MTRPMTNDELIKLKSRIYRGYRAPIATSEFYEHEQIVSITRDGAGNVTQTVHSVSFEDGTFATKTTDYTIDGSNNVTASTITYNYSTP